MRQSDRANRTKDFISTKLKFNYAIDLARLRRFQLLRHFVVSRLRDTARSLVGRSQRARVDHTLEVRNCLEFQAGSFQLGLTKWHVYPWG